jgi:DNA-binding beta-propeller fold protein YncE
MRTRSLLCLVAIACLASMSSREVRAGVPHYKIVDRWQIGGDGGWDLLTIDAERHRLFFGRGTRTVCVDLNTGQVVGEIPDTPGIHGVALVPEVGSGFTSNGRDSTVTVFDLGSLATVARIHLEAKNPDVIVYEPVSKRVFTFNAGSGNTTAIDAATHAVVGTLDLGGRPEFAVADGRGNLFVNLEDSSAVVGFDASSLKIKSRWALAPGEEPTGLAIDLKRHRLFSACNNDRMIILDSESGRKVAEVPIGKGVDGAGFDPGTRLAFSSNGEGTLTVIREDSADKYSVVGTVPTQRGARTMALDPKTHRIYLAAAQYGETPAPTADHPHPRPPMLPGTFVILVMDR